MLKLGPSFDGDLDEAADSYRFRKDADEWDIIERVGEELGIQFTYRVDELDEVVLRPLLDDFEEWLRRGKPGRPALEASVDRLLEGASLPSVCEISKSLRLDERRLPDAVRVKRITAALKVIVAEDLVDRLEKMVSRWSRLGYFELKSRRVGQRKARDRRIEPAFEGYTPPGRS